jgi:maltooligosyltrehalose trehalohydrolase
VRVVLPAREPAGVSLAPAGEGVFLGVVPDLPPGSDYAFSLDGGPPRPDPVSRCQPGGVHAPSRSVDAEAFPWSDGAWRGLPLEALVIYELHVGTFTASGTFAGVHERLAYLKELGITAVELMPVAEFPGTRNWGYDGVHLYAPQSSYGGPEGLKALVDACHGAGLAVVLDVVYNHLGPEGNYLGEFAPYFSDRHHTPWGNALNFDGADSDPVRRHFIDNALHWLTEYHVDALRLDAIHGMFDFSARHLLAELAEAFHRQAAHLGRQAWLIAESDLNDTRVLSPPEVGGWGLDAQWSDDFHHAQHALLTGATRGYFVDFGRVHQLGKALTHGYVIDGLPSRYRRRRHGNASLGRPGRQFVISVQNHDQVANACQSRRLSVMTDPARERLAAALLLCAPNVPLLFMGQEYGARTPFHYFTSHGDPALARAVTEGRRAEQAAFEDGEPFADPQAPGTFSASILDWKEAEREPHAGLLRLYRELLALRRAHPCLSDCDKTRTRVATHEARRWLVLERGEAGGRNAAGAVLMLCNFGPHPVPVPVPRPGEEWRLALWSRDERFGKNAAAPPPPENLAPERLRDGELELAGWSAALYLAREQP